MYNFIQTVHSLYIVAKCNFFSVAKLKDLIKYLQKCEGCTHFCEILYIYIFCLQCQPEQADPDNLLNMISTASNNGFNHY